MNQRLLIFSSALCAIGAFAVLGCSKPADRSPKKTAASKKTTQKTTSAPRKVVETKTSRSKPPKTSKPAPKAPLARGPETLPPIKPHRLPKFEVQPTKRMVDSLINAHYDPLALGLWLLEFDVTLTTKRKQSKVVASGTWHKSGRLELKLSHVERSGRRVPRSPISHMLYQHAELRLKRLLDGLGRGFLSKRLMEWKTLRGKIASGQKGAITISLSSKSEFGVSRIEAIVDKGFKIAKVTRHSPHGVSRSIAYRYRDELNRNLVTGGKMAVAFSADSKVPQKARRKLQASNEARYEIRYGRKGRFLLPTTFIKRLPAMKETMTLELRYKKVLPALGKAKPPKAKPPKAKPPKN
jgi:hypothetical protein